MVPQFVTLLERTYLQNLTQLSSLATPPSWFKNGDRALRIPCTDIARTCQWKPERVLWRGDLSMWPTGYIQHNGEHAAGAQKHKGFTYSTFIGQGNPQRPHTFISLSITQAMHRYWFVDFYSTCMGGHWSANQNARHIKPYRLLVQILLYNLKKRLKIVVQTGLPHERFDHSHRSTWTSPLSERKSAHNAVRSQNNPSPDHNFVKKVDFKIILVLLAGHDKCNWQKSDICRWFTQHSIELQNPGHHSRGALNRKKYVSQHLSIRPTLMIRIRCLTQCFHSTVAIPLSDW